MRFLLILALLAAPAVDLRADSVAAVLADAGLEHRVSPGLAYGANSFAGLALGAIVGAAGGAIPYARDRQGQDPNSVILGAIYGSVAGAVGLGVPLSAYEVASNKSGAGITVLYDSLGFAVLGGVVGAGAGMLSYRHKVDSDPQDANDFLAAAATGVCGGALLGFGVGIYEAVFWAGNAPKIPGSGIHASAGLLAFSPVLALPQGRLLSLPNATLFKVEF